MKSRKVSGYEYIQAEIQNGNWATKIMFIYEVILKKVVVSLLMKNFNHSIENNFII